SEFQGNVKAISHLLANLPAGSRVTILGITDASLTNPYALLSADVSPDSGYFGSRLRVARQELVTAWNTRAKNLVPTAPHTDLIGVILYASEILSRSHATRKVVVLFSDMRQEANGLDLETPQIIDLKKTLSYVEQRKLF